MADRFYVAQARSLFSSVTASSLMAGIFLINVYRAYEVEATSGFLVLGALGCLFNVWRNGQREPPTNCTTLG
ncbi:hypothetical protein [Novosphingobium sp. 9U]|uniref:hypothetical protein n=1 Tax=Novosphingobium sp. 9U TaxID=2653158 RepID=UPI0012F17F1D|nr:hypothetical protein [Novosphingobium sp. 9U]VWX52753.1 hypothetical protein NOVOSPHI9U_400006 [Novosphingobium sp. 9U]